MDQLLFGIETELAVAAERGDGAPLPVDQVTGLLMDMARQSCGHLPDERCGMFLENGSRLYRDSAGSADHLEYCTPETVTPWDTVRQILAGEALMLDLRERVLESNPQLGCLRVMKHNANYGRMRGATWGTHESYLHRCPVDRLHKQMVPFLVTRILVTGAGGFDPMSPGLKFLLSPRVAHLAREVSGDTTHDRPIFNTKNESLCGEAEGWKRLHLVCGESNCSETSMWLKVASTAMVVAMISAGIPVGEGVALLRPLEAMKRFAADPELKRTAKAAGGCILTALAVQRHYLRAAETHKNAEFMPNWAPVACELWRSVLDGLESGGSAAMAARLDWAIKYALFGGHLERRGFSWEETGRLTKLAGRLQRAQERVEYGASGMTAVFLEPRHIQNPCPEIGDLLDARLQERFLEFLKLRDELYELDLRFMTLGPGGLFRQLEAAGVLRHHVPGVENIARAREEPPEGSRAMLRGQAVRDLCRQKDASGALCMWNVVHVGSRVLDLRDPFEKVAKWTERAEAEVESLPRFEESLFRRMRMLRSLEAELRGRENPGS